MWPWQNDEFGAGLVAVAVVVAIILAMAGAYRQAGGKGALPVGGIGFAAAGLWSVRLTHPAPVPVVVGVIGLALSAAVADLPRVSPWLSVPPAAFFGWLIGFHGDVPGPTWVRVGVAITAAFGGLLAAEVDHRWRVEAIGLPMLAVTVAGVYATAPDTEETLPLLAIGAVLATLGWPLGLVRLGRAGAAASIGLVAWVTSYDGRGRHSSVVGGLACLGLLATLPVASFVANRSQRSERTRSRFPPIILVLALHVVVVLIASRIAGLRRDVPTATAITAVTAVVAVSVCALMATLLSPVSCPDPTSGDDLKPRPPGVAERPRA